MTDAAGTLVDSNVLLDIFTGDSTWFEWSSEALAAAAQAGPPYVNPVVYAESASVPLPDFLVGAHAAVDDLALLTLESRRYRTWFPTVRLLAPTT